MLHTPHIHTFIFEQTRIHTDTLTGQIIIHRFVSCHSYFVVYLSYGFFLRYHFAGFSLCVVILLFIWWFLALCYNFAVLWFLALCYNFAVYLMVSFFVLQFCCLSDGFLLCVTILLFIWWFLALCYNFAV